MRKITIFSTQGSQKTEINTEATLWGEVKNLLENIGYDLESLHATENINRTNLEHSGAALPTGDFTIFLRPKKTKSGLGDFRSKSFKELRSIIKEQGRDCIEYLNSITEKGNYTQMSTVELAEGLSKYVPKTVKKVSNKKISVKKEVKTSVKPETKNYIKKQIKKEDSIARLKKEFEELEKGF